MNETKSGDVRNDIDNPLFLVLSNLVSTSRVGTTCCESCLKNFNEAGLRPTIQTCRECPAMTSTMDYVQQLINESVREEQGRIVKICDEEIKRLKQFNRDADNEYQGVGLVRKKIVNQNREG